MGKGKKRTGKWDCRVGKKGKGGKEKNRGRGENNRKTAENRDFKTKFSTLEAPVMVMVMVNVDLYSASSQKSLGQIWHVSDDLWYILPCQISS